MIWATALYSAAHPPPLLLRQSGEVVKLLERGRLLAGGIVPFTEVQSRSIPATDLSCTPMECWIAPHGESFGEERFVNAVVAWHSAPVDTMCDHLIQALFAHGGGVSPQDDISVLALEYQGGVVANGT